MENFVDVGFGFHMSHEQIGMSQISNRHEPNIIYRGSPLYAHFYTRKKNVLHEICANMKILHLHVHKPKIVVVETVLVIFVYVGDPL